MKKKSQLLLYIFSCLCLYSCGQNANKNKLLNPKSFNDELRNNKEIVLLDVRTTDENKTASIAGTNEVLIDYYADDFSEQIEKLDKNKTYFVYCRSGNRSAKTATLMQSKGFKHVVNLDGGINAWQEDGLPVK